MSAEHREVVSSRSRSALKLAVALSMSVGLAAAVLVGGFVRVALAQQDLSQVEVKAERVAGNIHVLTGRGGNIGVSAGSDGLLMIDDQFEPLAPKIRQALEGLGSGRLAFVLNTHWHGDHTGGNPVFGNEATIVAHENVRRRLASQQKVRGRVIEPMAPAGLPVITFRESVTIHFNGEEVEVLHFPKGHTDGDSVIFFKGSKVVHMGDQFFAGRFPFVDLESGGDVDGLIADIETVLGRIGEDVKIIPGHGPVGGKADLAAYLGMLKETRALVAGKIAAGKSLDDIKKEGLPEKWAAWSWEFIKTDFWLETLYNSLKRASA
jgi:glyoxylase-like metal-dependent hydrolase (beta-lactamase superfamily II)